jgi:hypothetical protein
MLLAHQQRQQQQQQLQQQEHQQQSQPQLQKTQTSQQSSLQQPAQQRGKAQKGKQPLKDQKKAGQQKGGSSSSNAQAAPNNAAVTAMSGQSRAATPMNGVDSPINVTGSGTSEYASAISRYNQQQQSFMQQQQGPPTTGGAPVNQGSQLQAPHQGRSGTATSAPLAGLQGDQIITAIHAATTVPSNLTPEQAAQIKAMTPEQVQRLFALAQQNRIPPAGSAPMFPPRTPGSVPGSVQNPQHLPMARPTQQQPQMQQQQLQQQQQLLQHQQLREHQQLLQQQQPGHQSQHGHQMNQQSQQGHQRAQGQGQQHHVQHPQSQHLQTNSQQSQHQLPQHLQQQNTQMQQQNIQAQQHQQMQPQAQAFQTRQGQHMQTPAQPMSSDSRLGQSGTRSQYSQQQAQQLATAVAAKSKQNMQQQQLQQQQPGPQVAQQQSAQQQQHRNQLQRMAQMTGMSLEQLNAFLTAQKAKLDKLGVPHRQQQTTILEQLNAIANKRNAAAPGEVGTVAGPQPQATRAQNVPVSSPADGVALSSPGVTQGLVAASAARNAATPSTDELIWRKLEAMQMQHKSSLEKLYPIIRRLSKGQSAERQETLMKHLKDCFSLLNMRRTPIRPVNLTVELVDRVEGFINRVVTVYSKFLKDVVNQTNADPDRRASMMRQGDQSGNMGAGEASRTGPMRLGDAPAQQLQIIGQDATARGSLSQRSAPQQELGPASDQQHQVKPSPGISLTPPQVTVQSSTASEPLVSASAPSSVARNDHSTNMLSAQSLAQRQQEQLQRQRVSQRTDERNDVPLSSGGLAVENQRHSQAELIHRQQQQQLPQTSSAVTSKGVRGSVSQAELTAGLSAALQSAQRSRNPNDINMVKQQMAQAAILQRTASSEAVGRPAGDMGSTAPAQIPPVAPPRRAEPTLQERVLNMQQTVKTALEQSQRLENLVDSEMKRAKNERIQNTLTALRNNNLLSASDVSDVTNRFQTPTEKRPLSSLDVQNSPGEDNVIKSKTVFECSAEVGLRLAKRPKNETADLKALRDAVEADCRAAKARHENISLEICTEYGLPVVVCQLLIPEIKLPKLYLRVQRGYPRKGGATYRFERPPLGWVGVLLAVKARFKNAMSIAPAASVGVAAYLDAWAREAEAAIAEAKEDEADEEGPVRANGTASVPEAVTV